MNRRRTRPNWFRIILLCLLVLGASYVNRFVIATRPSPFVPTPTATRSPESFVTEAQEYFKQGKLLSAIDSYQQAILSNPNDPAVYVALAQTQVFAGKYEDAQTSAESAILLNNDSSMAHAVLAWSMGAQGDYIEAGNSMERALTLDPNNALAHAYYVEILVDSGSFDVIDKAIEESKIAVALAPNSLETHRARGYILEATGNYEEAIREYQLAIDMNPKIADLHLSQGRNYRALGSYEDAITAFSNADALNPEDPMPDYLISRTYATRGEFGKAMQYAEQAVSNNPGDPNLRGNLGAMYYQNSYWTEAIAEFNYVVNGGFTDNGDPINTMPLTPDNIRVAEYYYMYGLALAKTNKCSPALEIARIILERVPANELAVENANAIISRCELNLEQTPEPLPTSPEPASATPTEEILLTATPTPNP